MVKDFHEPKDEHRIHDQVVAELKLREELRIRANERQRLAKLADRFFEHRVGDWILAQQDGATE